MVVVVVVDLDGDGDVDLVATFDAGLRSSSTERSHQGR
jgi:hypothetical protein